MPKTMLTRSGAVILGGLTLLAGGARESRAAAITQFDSRVQVGSDYNWSYTLPIANDRRVEAGDFFVLYDFNGYNGTHSEPEGWAFSTETVGPVPARVAPQDDPNLPNLVWRRTGDTIDPDSDDPGVLADEEGETPGGGSPPIFLAGSTFGFGGVASVAAQATLDTGPLTGLKASEIGSEVVPSPVDLGIPVPEPATLTTGLLLGLAGLAWRRRQARAKA